MLLPQRIEMMEEMLCWRSFWQWMGCVRGMELLELELWLIATPIPISL
jgi:hypothetical protein